MARTRVCFSFASFLVVAVCLLVAVSSQPVAAQDADSSDQVISRNSDHSTADWFYFTTGKYHTMSLQQQFWGCLGGVCNDCMVENFADPYPTFDGRDWENCNGTLGSTAVIRRALGLSRGDWGLFGIYSQRSVIQAAIDACGQNWGEVNCGYLDSNQNWVNVSGAYLLGTERSVGELDLLIDRSETGYPMGPWPDNFAALEPYIWDALGAFGDPTYHEWEVIHYGAMMYLADMDANPPTAHGDGGDTESSSEEVELALKIVAHSMVAMCSWEGTWPELLTENGIEPFCFEVYCTPSYVYWIQMAYDHIVDPWVGNEPMSWGAVKAMYR